MPNPTITVLIPAYKAERFLAETLESVAGQTFTDWEIIVTEDGSKDRTEEIVRAFAAKVEQPVIYNRHEQNNGLPTARNTGISAARGEWIAFVDADDLWTTHHLETLLATAQSENCELVFAGTQPFDHESGEKLTPCVPTPEDLRNLPLAIFTGHLSVLPSSVMVDRRVFTKYGMIATEFPHANDTEYWLRILHAGGKAGYTGQTTCLYRKHAGAMSLRAARILTNTAQICERYSRWDRIPPEISRERVSSLYRYAARWTSATDPQKAYQLMRQSFRTKPVTPRTWFYLALTYCKALRSRAASPADRSSAPV